MNKRDEARIVLSQLEASSSFIKIVTGGYDKFGSNKIIINVMSGRKFYETKRKRNVYDWVVSVISILNFTDNKQLQKSIENKIEKTFGIDRKIHPSIFETILLKHEMSNITKSYKDSVAAVIGGLLDSKGIGYSVFEER